MAYACENSEHGHPIPLLFEHREDCVAHGERNENRLSDADRVAIRARLTATVEGWNGSRGNVATDLLALTRVGAHAIGCSVDDLRQSELDEIALMADAVRSVGMAS